jgi:DNA-binding transcriptional regulator YiaG
MLCKIKPYLIWLVGLRMEHLGEKVKELRTKKGWAQEDLAWELGVSLSTVQRWEKRGAKPTRLARRELTKLFREAGISNE